MKALKAIGLSFLTAAFIYSFYLAHTAIIEQKAKEAFYSGFLMGTSQCQKPGVFPQKEDQPDAPSVYTGHPDT